MPDLTPADLDYLEHRAMECEMTGDDMDDVVTLIAAFRERDAEIERLRAENELLRATLNSLEWKGPWSGRGVPGLGREALERKEQPHA